MSKSIGSSLTFDVEECLVARIPDPLLGVEEFLHCSFSCLTKSPPKIVLHTVTVIGYLKRDGTLRWLSLVHIAFDPRYGSDLLL